METIKINNTILEYNKVIYIDSVNGNDETGDGSEINPYKTLQYSLNKASSNEAIYVMPGTYTVGAIHDIFDKKYVDIIGKGYDSNIIIEGNRGSVAQYTGGDITNNFYRIRFSVSENFASNATGTSFLYEVGTDSPTSTTYDFGVYNCIFEDKYGILTLCFFQIDGTTFFDVKITKLEIINSVFHSVNKDLIAVGMGGLNTQSVIDKIKIINTAASLNNIMTKSSIGYKNNLTNVLFDNDYYIISDGWEHTGNGTNPDGTQANIGVYGGEFTWETFSYPILIQDNTSIKTATGDGLEIIGQSPVTKEMFDEYGVNLNEIIGNINKTVNMDYKQDLGDKKIYGYKLVGYSDISKLKIYSK